MRKKIKILSAIMLVSILYCFIISIFFHSAVNVPAVSDNAYEQVKMPIVMYHSVLKDTDLSGKYVITPAALEEDIRYLKDNGYQFVSVQNLIDYIDSNIPLPQNPVMLTFDDGFYNNYGYVKPILEKYDAKAVISVVGSYTDEYSESNIANLTYGYLRWNDVYDMFIDDRIDIANHSYDFHTNNKGRNGSKRKKGESIEEYKKIFYNDTEKAQNRFLDKTGFCPIVYTYPFGAYSKESSDILKEMGFRMSFSCDEGINIITKNPDCLFLLKRYNRPSGITTHDFFENILNKI